MEVAVDSDSAAAAVAGHCAASGHLIIAQPKVGVAGRITARGTLQSLPEWA